MYVGGLTEATVSHQLRNLFGAYGIIMRADVIRHKHNGKSAGYGFVEMMTMEQAMRAVTALEGTLFQGNRLRVFVMSPVTIHA